MKLSIALSALLVAGFLAATTEPASAIVYCQYVDYPVGCTVRAGVVLRPRPVARAVATPGVGRCRHTHEPWRSGGSRRPSLKGLSCRSSTSLISRIARGRGEGGSCQDTTVPGFELEAGAAPRRSNVCHWRDIPLRRRSIAHSGVHSGRMPTKLPVMERAHVNSPIIRIHSERKWPERIVFDSTLPTMIPARPRSWKTAFPVLRGSPTSL